MPASRKCLVWDLDNTLWDGICLEGEVHVRPEVRRTIVQLDRRGILLSIASRGDESAAVEALREHELEDYFLAPHINWLPKPKNVISISKELDIGIDAVAFIDDDEFERSQMRYMLPQVLTIEAGRAPDLPSMADFDPGPVTPESTRRRSMYVAEKQRRETEAAFRDRHAFLLSCDMRLAVREMQKDDVPRVMELATRTHQLNTTGLRVEREEVEAMLDPNRSVPDRIHRKAFVADLQDRFGSYGKIGTAIVAIDDDTWRLEYVALSCRVLGRGVERAFVSLLLRAAARCRRRFAEATFRDTGRNRQMRVLYQMLGFRQLKEIGDGSFILRRDLDEIPPPPDWIAV